MMSHDERVTRAAEVAGRLLGIPWHRFEERDEVFESALEDLSDQERYSFVVSLVYTLVDQMQAAIQTVYEYDGGPQRLEQLLIEHIHAKSAYVAKASFERLTKDLDINPEGPEMSDPIE